jgi:hypothetical protein
MSVDANQCGPVTKIEAVQVLWIPKSTNRGMIDTGVGRFRQVAIELK